MELFHLFKTLNRKKWIILSCVLVAITTAFVLTMNEKRVYKSVAQISTGFTLPDAIKLSDEHFNTQQIDVKFSNVIENITSPKVLQLLSYSLLLHDLTEKSPFNKLTTENKVQPTKKFNASVTTLLKQKHSSMQMLDPALSEDQELIDLMNYYGYTVDWLHNNLQVARYQRTDYINITFQSQNPELSAFVVNSIVPEFNRYYYQDKRSRTDSSIVSLDTLVQQKKAILDAKTSAKNNYMSSQNIVDVNLQGSNTLQQINQYETQLTEEKGNQQGLVYKVQQLDRMIKAAKTQGLNPSISNSSISPENNQYLSLRKQYNDLYKDYVQKGSNDSNLKKQLDDLSNEMQKLRLAYDNTTNSKTNETTSIEDIIQKKLDAEGDLQTSNQKIVLIQAKLNELKGGVSTMVEQGAGVDKLDKEIQMASSEYLAAKERLNVALNIDDGSSAIKQTLIGQPALYPEPSHRNMIIALAGAAALILSCIVIIFLEYLDQSIKTPSQFQRLTHLPLLGAVNFVDINRKDILENVTYTDSEDRNRHNTFRELLRKLRFEMENSGKRIFLFTSTEPGQGKTTLIQALSYSLSLGKKKVLIIDTNFCNNDLTKDLSASPVLEKFYVNGKPFSIEDVQGLISKTKVEGVDTIGCGEGDYTPSEILPKNHLLNYLNDLLKVYDYIFLEGAPLNNYTDTKELVHYSDGLVAIFSSETALTAIDRESIKFLKQQDRKFVGAILNKVQTENLEM